MKSFIRRPLTHVTNRSVYSTKVEMADELLQPSFGFVEIDVVPNAAEL